MTKTSKHGLKMKPRRRKGIFLYSFATPANAHGDGTIDFSTREIFTQDTWVWLTESAKKIIDEKYHTDCTVVGTGVVWLEG